MSNKATQILPKTSLNFEGYYVSKYKTITKINMLKLFVCHRFGVIENVNRKKRLTFSDAGICAYFVIRFTKRSSIVAT